MSMSFAVYPTTVGFPVVPLEAWTRTTCDRGTANRPNGYPSRKSCLVVNGKRARSDSDRRSSGCAPTAAHFAR